MDSHAVNKNIINYLRYAQDLRQSEIAEIITNKADKFTITLTVLELQEMLISAFNLSMDDN
jgi:uncharacterized phage-associated protein